MRNPTRTISVAATLFLLAAIAGSPVALARGNASRRTQVVERETARGGAAARPARARASDDASRYAARDRAAKQQKEFAGGDYVVIGLSGTAIVVILLLVLLL